MHHGSLRTRHRLCRFTYGKANRIRHCIPSPLDGTVCDALHPRLFPTCGRTLPSRPFRRRQIITVKKAQSLGEHTTDVQAPPGNFSASLSQEPGCTSAPVRPTTRQAIHLWPQYASQHQNSLLSQWPPGPSCWSLVTPRCSRSGSSFWRIRQQPTFKIRRELIPRSASTPTNRVAVLVIESACYSRATERYRRFTFDSAF